MTAAPATPPARTTWDDLTEEEQQFARELTNMVPFLESAEQQLAGIRDRVTYLNAFFDGAKVDIGMLVIPPPPTEVPEPVNRAARRAAAANKKRAPKGRATVVAVQSDPAEHEEPAADAS